MFDCHYDLLTYIYVNRRNLRPVISHCRKIFFNNITGGIFNLFYMSEKEMLDELGVQANEIDIIQNLKVVNFLIRRYRIIPRHIRYIVGIEGLDYLKNINDIDILYNLGLRSTGIVWNNKNKFGAGVRAASTEGLTSLGEELIEKLVNKRIAIDLSHANERTFYDIIYKCQELKRKGLEPIVFASHSNSRMYCNVPRNLSNRQLLEIKKLDGIIGVVSIKDFCSSYNNINYEMAYINHINYLRRLFGDVNNIALATDDISYYKIQPEIYQNMNVFKQEEVKSKIENLLLANNYSNQEIKQILTENAQNKLINKLI
ncbi:MAG: dipeptidase [Clostridia bacterium]